VATYKGRRTLSLSPLVLGRDVGSDQSITTRAIRDLNPDRPKRGTHVLPSHDGRRRQTTKDGPERRSYSSDAGLSEKK